MLRNICYFLIFFIVNSQLSIANEIKKKIVNKLIKIDSIEFNFIQKTNNLKEVGSCKLLFPKKLKCDYKNDKLKQLIINNNRLAITQKRYNKTYYYPISNSSIDVILDKNKLIRLIEKNELIKNKNNIILKFQNNKKKEIIVLFNKTNYNLDGWIVNDQLNNVINFKIDIIAVNRAYKKEEFIIPELN